MSFNKCAIKLPNAQECDPAVGQGKQQQAMIVALQVGQKTLFQSVFPSAVAGLPKRITPLLSVVCGQVVQQNTNSIKL